MAKKRGTSLHKGQLNSGHRVFQNANQKLQGFLPYHTNKDRSTFFGDFFGYDPCLFGRAEILVVLGLHFGRNDDLINSF